MARRCHDREIDRSRRTVREVARRKPGAIKQTFQGRVRIQGACERTRFAITDQVAVVKNLPARCSAVAFESGRERLRWNIEGDRPVRRPGPFGGGLCHGAYYHSDHHEKRRSHQAAKAQIDQKPQNLMRGLVQPPLIRCPATTHRRPAYPIQGGGSRSGNAGRPACRGSKLSVEHDLITADASFEASHRILRFQDIRHDTAPVRLPQRCSGRGNPLWDSLIHLYRSLPLS
jgi:hypothetical protein